jgi:hypothetical protein
MLAPGHRQTASRRLSLTKAAQRWHTPPQSASPIIRRSPSCACGGSCPRCRPTSTLKVGAPDDAYEREANSVADRVMRMTAPSSAQNCFFKPVQNKIQRQEKKEEEPEDKTGEVIGGGLGTVASQAMEYEPFKLWLDANLLNYLKNTFWEERSGEEKAVIVTQGILTAGLFSASFVDPNMRKTFSDVDLGAALSWIPYNPIGGFKYKLPGKISPNYQFNLELQGDDYLDLLRESYPRIPQLGLTFGLSSQYSKQEGFSVTGGSIEMKIGAGIVNLKGFINQPVSPYPILIPPSEPGGPYSWLMQELPGIDEELWPKGTGLMIQVNVMRIPQLFSGAPQRAESGSATEVNRKCKECEEEGKKLHRKENGENKFERDASLENYIHDLNRSGQPLPDSSRKFFEPKFGYDFSSIKIHHDSDAANSADSINALAYTHGNNIVFGANQFSPESESGKKLLAHELAHVVQQHATPAPPTRRSASASFTRSTSSQPKR